MSRPGLGEPILRVDDEVNLPDYILVVWRYRWVVFAVVVVALVLTFVLTLMTPRVYESSAALIAPKEGSGASLLGGLAAASGLFPHVPVPSIPSLTPNRDLLVSVLKSRTMGQAVVEHFKLLERYGVPNVGDALKRLQAATLVSVTKEGVISIKVEDVDPWAAAEIANFYVAQLDRLVMQYGVGEAGRQGRFLTEQLARAKVGLDITEETLRRFQEKTGHQFPMYHLSHEPPPDFQAEGVPATFILSRARRIVLRHVGAADWGHARVVKFLEGLLAEDARAGAG